MSSLFDGESLITPSMIAEGRAISSHANLVHADDFAVARGHLELVLELARQRFERGVDPREIVHKVVGDMHDLRSRCEPSLWAQLVPLAQEHPVAQQLHQDPFTKWSFDKPRGYSGDAQLLDFIYEHPSAAARIEAATPVGQALYDYTKRSPSSVAVRDRRDRLAKHVDAVAATRPEGAEILTIAAGHLREAAQCSALGEGRIKRWVALDQDPLSIGAVTRDFPNTAIEAIDGSVRGILKDTYELGSFDFVYAAGLYDYLPRAVAVKLTRKCMKMLKPGGQFLFANFAEDIVDDGYMETFMNWSLLLRGEADMWDIVNASVDRNEVEASVEFGAHDVILYGMIRKLD